MRHWLYCDTAGWIGSVGLLLLRLVMGTAFVFHGWPKIQNPSGWMGPDAAFPTALVILAAVAEFGGGIALILGLLTRLAVLGIASVMTVAVFMVHMPQGDPFVGKGGESYELPAVYLACTVLFLLLGPGRYSVDALIFRQSAKTRSDATLPRQEQPPALEDFQQRSI